PLLDPARLIAPSWEDETGFPLVSKLNCEPLEIVVRFTVENGTISARSVRLVMPNVPKNVNWSTVRSIRFCVTNDEVPIPANGVVFPPLNFLNRMQSTLPNPYR